MKFFFLLLILLILIQINQSQNISLKLICSNDNTCGYPNGECILNECICLKGWIIQDHYDGCTYQQKSKLTAFLLSFFLGIFGVDWFYLSCGNFAYIIAGIIKLITLGACGIWWLVDWIRLLANAFQDGNGMPLLNWNN
ncbi:unnamed protein product [Adineta steineri]|uniref:TM2 domain-containing protein n=1 Tax=Adineta steineri TaxID=433720 RepID=A0A818VPD2_9BILA|nr:unnamed protein product [Adineta steineri]CAF3714034.1 unnamed protein product [Adineta steineri]